MVVDRMKFLLLWKFNKPSIMEDLNVVQDRLQATVKERHAKVIRTKFTKPILQEEAEKRTMVLDPLIDLLETETRELRAMMSARVANR